MEENNVEEQNEQEEVSQEKKRELQEYEKIEGRLKDIEDKITQENLDMDQSLELYEEAVNLGLKAAQTIENNVLVDTNQHGEEDGEEAEDTEDEAR